MIRITNKEIINAISGTIYEMHPYHNPENIDKIMEGVNKWLDEKEPIEGKVDDVFKVFQYNNFKEVTKELKDILMNILEFRQLNISRHLKEQGIKDIDDDRNKGIKFTSIYDKDTKDSRYYDFIDLDACIQNIIHNIDIININKEDCFLCKYAKEYGSVDPSNCKECNNCILNPKYKYNRECHPMSLKPRNKWTKEEKEKYGID